MRAFERWQYLSRAPQIVWDLAVRNRYSFHFDQMPMVVRGMSPAARLNMLRAGLNLAYRRSGGWSWPLNMQMELTSYCNIRCPVCPVGTKELTRPAQAMDVELFERILHEAGPYLLTLALWGWGEPLLHPQLARVLKVSRRYPAVTMLSTNGQTLDRDEVQGPLRESSPHYLIAAIDGLCDETNSVYRRGAKLQPALDGVRALAEWKRRTGAKLPILHFRFIAMKHNEHEVPQVREFAAAHGFDMVSIRGLSIFDSAKANHGSLVPITDGLRAYGYENGKRRTRSDFICQHAFSYPTVLADGAVVACDQDYNGKAPYGTVSRDRSFADVWFGEQAAAVRRTVRDSPHDLSFCRSCAYADREISSCSMDGYQLRPIEL